MEIVVLALEIVEFWLGDLEVDCLGELALD